MLTPSLKTRLSPIQARSAALYRFKLGLLLIAFVVCAQNTSAQSNQPPRQSSRNEYRACLDDQDTLNSQLPALQAKHQEHDGELKRL